MAQSLGVIGCGKMAYALLKGSKPENLASYSALYICDPDGERIDIFQREFGAVALRRDELIDRSDMIILAVKPQQVKEVLSSTHSLWSSSKLLISIVAGMSTGYLQKELADQTPVVRVMPNTPCLVGEGISVVAGGRYASEQQVAEVQQFFEAVGLSVILNEKYMDAVTAVSGSGPAYVFLLVEAMTEAAINVGLGADIARKLVLQTFSGSIDMLVETGDHPAVLKQQVCSPGGTTIAGVRALEENGIRKAVFEAVEKACLRSNELGRE